MGWVTEHTVLVPRVCVCVCVCVCLRMCTLSRVQYRSYLTQTSKFSQILDLETQLAPRVGCKMVTVPI